ncbi:hypothetical protein FRC98_01465 [Lujinxingia vulgaris]|uniref:Uncharacterized protein n=1 Tax=Lujinxingia vulgaris TaxID=2600176 RepID=A0A5C6XNX0_9DELT|nr:hypothetical protein FRC98_01465 [Lujinxingia vulgaris]
MASADLRIDSAQRKKAGLRKEVGFFRSGEWAEKRSKFCRGRARIKGTGAMGNSPTVLAIFGYSSAAPSSSS